MTHPTYRLAIAPNGVPYLILVDAFGIEHAQETIIEQEPVIDDSARSSLNA